jgi:hypothetical protein
LELSRLEFDSDDRKPIIRNGRGIWLYERRAEGTCFNKAHDYHRRYGILGRARFLRFYVSEAWLLPIADDF